MKIQNTNLLPKIVSRRDALNAELSKIKPRFLGRFTKLAIISAILPTLLGYYPNFGFPPIKQSVIHAQVQEQKGEIIANSFSKPLALPHPGYLSTKFSTYHPGIDIAAGLGMPIRPILDGEIVRVGRDLFGLGNFVEVLHENGFKSKYAHMGKIYVKTGDKITQENILGEVGMTGHTSGPHTHLEITHNGNYVNPQAILPEIPAMKQSPPQLP
ncbi:M23 family metallopeptidase [Patescibacteria group bacterium]|nr:M23 family metallopeptidase [Patescibacteria group bacterium]